MREGKTPRETIKVIKTDKRPGRVRRFRMGKVIVQVKGRQLRFRAAQLADVQKKQARMTDRKPDKKTGQKDKPPFKQKKTDRGFKPSSGRVIFSR